MFFEKGMRIIHMSDLHLTSDRHQIWGVDTFRHFVKALDRIANITNVDCIVVSGDIADDGDLLTYQYADEMLNTLDVPVLWCPGNHDNINTFFKFGQNSKSIISSPQVIKGFRFVSVNSVAPDDDNPNKNRSKGIIFENDFQKMKIDMQYKGLQTILVMHHPSFDPGGWLANKILKNKEVFMETIQKYEDIFLILCGHIHYYMRYEMIDKTFISAPSVGFAFNKDLPQFEIDNGNEGFLIIDIENRHITIEAVKL